MSVQQLCWATWPRQFNSYVGQLDHILKYAVFRDINAVANIPFSLLEQISNSPVDNDSKLTRFMNF